MPTSETTNRQRWSIFLFALIDDADASAVMNACKVDLGPLKESVANYIDNELETLVTEASLRRRLAFTAWYNAPCAVQRP
jgi:hypothetical protein